MPYAVDFHTVSATGLEASPVAPALAGLRANEARYLSTKYGHTFTTWPAAEAEGQTVVSWVAEILRSERDLVIASPALEASTFVADGTRFAHVFHESGLGVNVLYALDEGGKRAVGFKLSEGMEVPEELEARFRFARQRSKLAGTIRGTYFVIKAEHPFP